MAIRERKNILKLSVPERDKLIKAFQGIQNLPPDNKNSFYAIASLHGQPFRGGGWGNANWWGGYCNHGNVLFPTWHRAYLLHLENALRSISGCEDVSIPYWDELTDIAGGAVIPNIFLDKKYKFANNETVDNPLYSYKFQKGFVDHVGRPNEDYSKHTDYQTVRYPYSGLVGKDQIVATTEHNKKIDEMYTTSGVGNELDKQVSWWLKKGPDGSNMRSRYAACLKAPNFTVFSNTTSATNWNGDHLGDTGFTPVVALESPHNGVHLALGGYSIPGKPSHDLIAGANGDMGENDSASFDPIFYFHHAFIDKVFWEWQVLHNSKEKLEIIDQYPGTNSVDSQGPTPGVAAGVYLTLDTKLEPFDYTSRKLANIADLGYSYVDGAAAAAAGGGSEVLVEVKPEMGTASELSEELSELAARANPHSYVRVSGIDRAGIPGSFVVSVLAKDPKDDKESELIGFEPVLSRWHVAGCANCNSHLGVTVFMPLNAAWGEDKINRMEFTPVVETSQDVRKDHHWGLGQRMGLVEPIIGHI